MVTLATGLLLGLLLGMRHAFEPDHLAAVSVMATRRGTHGGGAMLGAAWGLGHTLALFVVGCVLASIEAGLPPRLAEGFELLVATMLLVLGTRAVLRAVADTTDIHHHGGAGNRWTVLRQPLLVGVIHGLAGSGALTALASASLPTLATRLLYMGLFGIGSVAGMASLTGLAGWPLARLGGNRRFSRGLSAATGSLSVIVGLSWGWVALHGLLRG